MQTPRPKARPKTALHSPKLTSPAASPAKEKSMTDAVKTAMKGDGWKSRKFLATMITLGVVWGTATLGWLLLERMTAAEWTTFSMWVVPLTLGVYSGGNVMEKFAVAKASNGK